MGTTQTNGREYRLHLQRGGSFVLLLLFSDKSCLHLSAIHSSVSTKRRRKRGCTHLHDTVPVVPRGHPEEGEEGHPKVGERRMSAQPFTRILFTAVCRRMRWEHISEGLFASAHLELPLCPFWGVSTHSAPTLLCLLFS